MKFIRSGRGLGDSLYLRPICEHWVRAGVKVTALTDYPEIFIGSGCETEPFRRHGTQPITLAHYTAGKPNPNTNIWQDICASAETQTPMFFKWRSINTDLQHHMRMFAKGRPIILVHGGREPMNRTDGFGIEVMPKKSAFDAALRGLSDCFTIRVGKGKSFYDFDCSLDLTDKTSVTDLLDLALICDGVVAQCSYMVPLAEIFGKPLLAIWAAKGLVSSVPFIRQITPQKTLTSGRSAFAMDDWKDDDIVWQARAFLNAEHASKCAS